MTHSLYWHPATYTTDSINGHFPPPHHHQLIGVGAVEVTGVGDGTEVNVWAKLSLNATVDGLLDRLEGAVGEAHEVVTMYGRRFGMPVLRAAALRAGYQASTAVAKIDSNIIEHCDIAEVIQRAIAPDEDPLSVFEMTSVCGLPERPHFNVAEMWEDLMAIKAEGPKVWKTQGPKIARRISSWCLLNAVLVACLRARYDRMIGEWDSEECSHFERAVVDAAADKAPIVAKMFDDEDT